MLLQRVTLENVRSYRDPVTFDFDPGLNILIGPNGGGKTNFIQALWLTLSKFLFRRYKLDRKGTAASPTEVTDLHRESERYLEPHEGHTAARVEVLLRAGPSDAENILRLRSLQRAYADEPTIQKKLAPLFDIPDDHIDAFRRSASLQYIVRRGALETPVANSLERSFAAYCQSVELALLTSRDFTAAGINFPFLFLSSSRQPGYTTAVDLRGLEAATYFHALQEVSRQPGGNLAGLAAQYFGYLKLRAKDKASNTRDLIASEIFDSNSDVQILRRYLNDLGYKWELVDDETMPFRQRIEYSKEGKSINPRRLSSGESELFNFLFGIIGTNIRNGVVMIDEPEIHLHPRWQSILLQLMRQLADSRALQYVICTHSPTFVTHGTIDSVARVFLSEGSSRLARPDRNKLPKRSQLVRIIHSHNNERIFFADHVVLVEGITDRVVFARIFDNLCRRYRPTMTLEVVEVHGYGNFDVYRQLLEDLEATVSIIADRDYLRVVGDQKVKALFQTDERKVDQNVLQDKKSTDRRTLISAVKEACATGDTTHACALIEYIEGRFGRLKDNLSADELHAIDENIRTKKAGGLYILRDGEIEDYLPECASLEAIVNLLEEPEWMLASAGTRELVRLGCEILGLDEREMEDLFGHEGDRGCQPVEEDDASPHGNGGSGVSA